MLTQREWAVLSCRACGLSNKEVAQRLGISANTVKHHVSRVLCKLGARSCAEAVYFILDEAHPKHPADVDRAGIFSTLGQPLKAIAARV